MTAERAQSRELVAKLRRRGVVLTVDAATLAVSYDAPLGALTAELWAEWKRLSVDVTAQLLAEVAEVAAMVAAAGIPAGAVGGMVFWPGASDNNDMTGQVA